ncbi:hypothetical protein [Roseobacter ponti]|uniref:Uncharacterized protein n=1 Tax=Roseobacter ponti TaxID=1891787 RepID=A0A858T1B3_9RHOB|nr:hypothetical protein [Roseobacter ponti]QJF53026.1 hypothetical protein G3256_18495 [Roseobacter ponti]
MLTVNKFRPEIFEVTPSAVVEAPDITHERAGVGCTQTLPDSGVSAFFRLD